MWTRRDRDTDRDRQTDTQTDTQIETKTGHTQPQRPSSLIPMRVHAYVRRCVRSHSHSHSLHHSLTHLPVQRSGQHQVLVARQSLRSARATGEVRLVDETASLVDDVERVQHNVWVCCACACARRPDQVVSIQKSERRMGGLSELLPTLLFFFFLFFVRHTTSTTTTTTTTTSTPSTPTITTTITTTTPTPTPSTPIQPLPEWLANPQVTII